MIDSSIGSCLGELSVKHERLDESAFATEADRRWILAFDGEDEFGLIQAQTHLSNGTLGLRGATEVTSRHERASQLLIRSIYAFAHNGARELVCLPAPIVSTTAVIDGPRTVHRRLDLKSGLLHVHESAQGPQGPVQIRTTQLLHATHPGLGIRLMSVKGGNVTDLLHFEWDTTPSNPVRHRSSSSATRLYSIVDESTGGVTVRVDGQETTIERSVVEGRASDFAFDVWQVSMPGHRPLDLASLSAADVAQLIDQHVDTWQERWTTAQVDLGADQLLQQGVNFAVFNLLQHDSASFPQATSPARGLSSTHHAGGTFFDAELHKDAYWAWTEPAVARRHLQYRRDGLDEARYLARTTGFRGARYPVSTDDRGRESGLSEVADHATGAWEQQDNVTQSLHVSANVAVALDRYVEVTRDVDFLLSDGLDMSVEIARFYVSALVPGPDGSLQVTAAMGPDEFHAGRRRVAYNDQVARFAIELAVRWCTLSDVDADARCAVLDRLKVTDVELETWTRLAHRIAPIAFDEDGLAIQFDGYLDLPDSTDRSSGVLGDSQIIKQADLALLATVMPGTFDPTQLGSLYAYYEPRTAHASSLSRIPYGTVAARLGHADTLDHLRELCRLNLDFDTDGEYTNGLHLSAYAGAWQVLFEGILGGCRSAGGLRFDPRLPTGCSHLTLTITVDQSHVDVTLRPNELTLTVAGPNPVDFEIAGEIVACSPGQAISVSGSYQSEPPTTHHQQMTDERG